MALCIPPDGAHAVEGSLHDALAHGIITQPEHDRQLRELRASSEPGGGGTLTSLPTRIHGTTQRLDLRNQWTSVSGPYADMGGAKAAIKAGCVVHGKNGGAWKHQTFESGGGCKHYQKCNGHTNCPVLLRIMKQPSGQCMVQVTTQVMHGLEENHWKRKNSPLTRQMESACAGFAAKGYTPKECRDEFQSTTLNSDGGSKNPAGGIEGEQLWGGCARYSVASSMHVDLYTMCCPACPPTHHALSMPCPCIHTCHVPASTRSGHRMSCLQEPMSMTLPFDTLPSPQHVLSSSCPTVHWLSPPHDVLSSACPLHCMLFPRNVTWTTWPLDCRQHVLFTPCPFHTMSSPHNLLSTPCNVHMADSLHAVHTPGHTHVVVQVCHRTLPHTRGW